MERHEQDALDRLFAREEARATLVRQDQSAARTRAATTLNVAARHLQRGYTALQDAGMPATAQLLLSEITACRAIQALILGEIVDANGPFPIHSTQTPATPAGDHTESE